MLLRRLLEKSKQLLLLLLLVMLTLELLKEGEIPLLLRRVSHRSTCGIDKSLLLEKSLALKNQMLLLFPKSLLIMRVWWLLLLQST